MLTRSDIISQPEYWVEELNGKIYDAIVRYMENHNFKQKDMAEHLNISTGRMSQILNSGDINFSYSKIVSILLKLDLIPHFDLENKSEYLKKELHEYAYHSGLTENKSFVKPTKKMKVITRTRYTSTIPKRISLKKKQISPIEEVRDLYVSKSSNSKRQIA